MTINQETYIADLLDHKFMCGQWAEQFLEKPDFGELDRDKNCLINYTM